MALIVGSSVRLTIHSQRLSSFCSPTDPRLYPCKSQSPGRKLQQISGLEVGDPGSGTSSATTCLDGLKALVSPSMEGADHSRPASPVEDPAT